MKYNKNNIPKFMRGNENKIQKEIYSCKFLLTKKENVNLTLHLNELENEEQTKSIAGGS